MMNNELKNKNIHIYYFTFFIGSNVFLYIYNDWFNNDYSNNYMD